MDFYDFLIDTLYSGVLSAALVLAVGFLLRVQISHWLSRDLHNLKASHDRQLEAYRVSLIAEVERAKAHQEIKKIAAQKIMEMELSAISEMVSAIRGLSVGVMTVVSYRQMMISSPATSQPDERAEVHREERAKADININRLISAYNGFEIFIDIEKRKKITSFLSVSQSALSKYGNIESIIDEKLLKKIGEEIYIKELDVIQMLVSSMKDFKDM